MNLKALYFVALVLTTVLVSSAATETSADEKKSEAIAIDNSQGQAVGVNYGGGGRRCWCCGRYGCPCCYLDDPKGAEKVAEKNQAADGATVGGQKGLCGRQCCNDQHGCYCCSGNEVVYELDKATGQYMLAGYGGGGWGGGGRGGGGRGGGGWGGGGGRGGGGGWGGGGGRGGGGGWGGGGRCPHCTPEEAAAMEREGKP